MLKTPAQVKREKLERLGANMRQAREASGKKVITVAHSVGVDAFSIRKWERGQVEPRILSVAAYAQAVGVMVGDLLKEVEG